MSNLPGNPKFIPSNTTKMFRYFCQKVLPAVYDDSLSYYELLCKLIAKINEVINTQNIQVDSITELQELYIELKNYVDTYFKDLNVQLEINNKLDIMAEDGTLATIINQNIFDELNVKIDDNIQDVSDLKDDMTTAKNDIISNSQAITNVNNRVDEVVEKIYPVGSVYISVNSTSPENIFGGQWEQILNRFLIGAGDDYEVDSIGGEKEVTLTVDQLPSHNHKSAERTADGQRNSDTGDNWHHQGINTEGATVPDIDTTFTGGNQPHNNIPPYYAVYMWKRIA